MNDRPTRAFKFGDFKLDLVRNVLLCNEEELQLRRQSFDLLCHLARHRGQVIARDVLVKAVWGTAPPHNPGDSMAQCIKDIRHAMGDDARWMIRTIPGWISGMSARTS